MSGEVVELGKVRAEGTAFAALRTAAEAWTRALGAHHLACAAFESAEQDEWYASNNGDDAAVDRANAQYAVAAELVDETSDAVARAEAGLARALLHAGFLRGPGA